MEHPFMVQSFELAPSAKVIEVAVGALRTLAGNYVRAENAHQRNNTNCTAMRFIDSIAEDLVFRELLRRRYALCKKEMTSRNYDIGGDAFNIAFLCKLYKNTPSLN